MNGALGFGIPGLGMFIFWGLIIFLVVMLVRGATGSEKSGDSKSAVEILNERLARGEIDREEFEQKKKALV